MSAVLRDLKGKHQRDHRREEQDQLNRLAFAHGVPPGARLVGALRTESRTVDAWRPSGPSGECPIRLPEQQPWATARRDERISRPRAARLVASGAASATERCAHAPLSGLLGPSPEPTNEASRPAGSDPQR